MTPNTPVTDDIETQLRRACAELDRSWRQGAGINAAELLTKAPALASDIDAAVELIYSEFAVREELGHSPDPAEYIQQFPPLADSLRQQFELHQILRLGEAPKAPRPVHDLATVAIGPYEVLEEIARGGAGVVYRARHRELHRLVALKVLASGRFSSAVESGRLWIEAEAAARLQHPNIVRIYEAGESQAGPWLAMELVHGGSLAIREPQPALHAAAIVETLARAVAYAHDCGVIHRDLKPANILMSASGAPMIADFGLAKLADDDRQLTIHDTLLGTPSYMAPEQAGEGNESVGRPADIHALGAVLYEMLTGRPPFLAETPLATLRLVVTQEPVSPKRLQPGVPVDLATICMKCLQKEPRRRYADAIELANDLKAFQAGEPIAARPVGATERTWKWVKRRPSIAALLATITLAMLLAVAGLLIHDARMRRELADTRRDLYTIQLAQAEQLSTTDPGRALALLDDTERCPKDLRDFAWGMLHTLCKQDRLTISDIHGLVGALAFSADGKTLQASTDEKKVFEWMVATGELLTTADGTLSPPESPWKVRVTKAGTVQVVDKATAALKGAIEPKNERKWRHLVASPDGTLLATVADETPQTVSLWDVATGKQRNSATGHFHPIDVLAFSPDGHSLATGGQDRLVRIWSTKDLKERLTCRGHLKTVNRLCFSSDNKLLASAGIDGTIRVWATQPDEGEILANGVKVTAMTFCSDGKHLATGNEEGEVRLWPLDDLSHPRTLPSRGGKALFIATSVDKRTMAAAMNTEIDLIDLATLERLATLSGHKSMIRAVAFSPDGKLLASSSEDGVLKLWNVPERKLIVSLQSPRGNTRFIGFSPDGRTVSAGNADGTATLRRVPSLEEYAALKGHDRPVLFAVYSPDGKTIATGGLDYLVKLWDADTLRERATLTGHTEYIFSAVYTPDGRTLATGSGNRFLDAPGEVRLWDVATGHSRGVLAGQCGPVAFSTDGRILATVHNYVDIRLWRSCDLD